MSEVVVTNYLSLISTAWKEKVEEIAKYLPFAVKTRNEFPDLQLEKRIDEGEKIDDSSYPAILWAVDGEGNEDRRRRGNGYIQVRNIEDSPTRIECRDYPLANNYTLYLSAEALYDYHLRWMVDIISAVIKPRDELTVDNYACYLDLITSEETSPFKRYKFMNKKFRRSIYTYILQGWFDKHNHGIPAPVYPAVRTVVARELDILEREAE